MRTLQQQPPRRGEAQWDLRVEELAGAGAESLADLDLVQVAAVVAPLAQKGSSERIAVK
jgi:hypothetical protein